MSTTTSTRSSIYFLGSRCGRYIKLGWSDNPTPNGRITTHRSMKNQDIEWVEVLVYVNGSDVDEKVLLTYFQDHLVDRKKYGREVFYAAPLMPYVIWLRMQWFSRHDPEALELPDFEPPTMWLPNELRVSTKQREWDLDAQLRSQKDPWWFLSDEIQDNEADYISPVEVLEAVRTAFGGVIDFDPASNSSANRYVKATQYLTEIDDGLSQAWVGPHNRPVKVWISVPFKQLSKWLAKLQQEMFKGHVSEAIVLAETRMLAANYFQPVLTKGTTFCIVNGHYPYGGKGNKMPAQQDAPTLVYFGTNEQQFTTAVQHLGHVHRVVA